MWEIAIHLAVAGCVCDGVFFTWGVLDEILDLIESVSEGFSYLLIQSPMAELNIFNISIWLYDMYISLIAVVDKFEASRKQPLKWDLTRLSSGALVQQLMY